MGGGPFSLFGEWTDEAIQTQMRRTEMLTCSSKLT